MNSSDSQWHDQQRAQICRIGRALFARGLAHSSAGNISVRVPPQAGGGLLITPSDACLDELCPADLVWLDDAGQVVCGVGPSKTAALHRAIYDADAQAGSVIHTHSTHLVALSLLSAGETGDDFLPPLTPYFVMKVGHVRRVRYHRPGDPAVAALVAQVIAAGAAQQRRVNAVMLDRLGPCVWQRDLSTALALLHELEETARLWLLTGRAPKPLDSDQIEELRKHFGASW